MSKRANSRSASKGGGSGRGGGSGNKGNDGNSNEKRNSRAARRERGKAKYASTLTRLREQVGRLGLRVVEVAGDGNCLFRSVATQVWGLGGVGGHEQLRQQVVEFMESDPDSFAPFVEDDEPWEKYLDRMRCDAEWGGHLELTALSRLLRVNFTIHHLDMPRFELRTNFDPKAVEYHLSYHDGDHYNALRELAEDDHMPAKSIHIGVAQVPVGATGATGAQKGAGEGDDMKGRAGLIKMIRDSTGCNNIEHIESLLDACDEDLDVCIEILLNEKRIGESWDNMPSGGEAAPTPTEGVKTRSSTRANSSSPAKKGNAKGKNASAAASASSASSASAAAAPPLKGKEKKEQKKIEKALARKKELEAKKNGVVEEEKEEKPQEPLPDLLGALSI